MPSLKEFTEYDPWIEFFYVYTLDNKWEYCTWEKKSALSDLKTALLDLGIQVKEMPETADAPKSAGYVISVSKLLENGEPDPVYTTKPHETLSLALSDVILNASAI